MDTVKTYTQQVGEILQAIEKRGGAKVRNLTRYSFFLPAEREGRKAIFREVMLSADNSIKNFRWLPAYDEILNWMQDTRGQGLGMIGSVGQGKSLILNYVLPVFFEMGVYVYKDLQSDIVRRANILTKSHQSCEVDIEDIKKTNIVILDDIGASNKEDINDWGNRYNRVTQIISDCEENSKFLAFTTNLDQNDIKERYTERVYDRMNKLCKIVILTGESMRKIKP